MPTKTAPEVRRAIEHAQFLEDLREVLKDARAQKVFKYLLRELRLAQYPPPGAEGNFLHEELGYLRTSRTIFDHLCEASPETAALLYTMIRKEENESRRMDELETQIGSSSERG